MFSVPTEYQRLLIEPAVNRFIANPTEYDLCFTACIFLFHFCDVVGHFERRSAEQVRQEIAMKDPLFDVVHTVCLAAKHVEVTNRKVRYVGFRAENAVQGRGAAFSDGSYYSDGSTHSDAQDVVVAVMPDGRKHDMHLTVQSVHRTIRNMVA